MHYKRAGFRVQGSGPPALSPILPDRRSGGRADRPGGYRVQSKKNPCSEPYGIYHVSNAGETSWYDYAKYILQLSKLKTSIVPLLSKELARPAKRPAMSVLDNSKFIKFTGFKMRNWLVALKDYLSNNKKEGEYVKAT